MWSSKMSRNSQIMILRLLPNKADNFFLSYCFCNPSTAHIFGANWSTSMRPVVKGSFVQWCTQPLRKMKIEFDRLQTLSLHATFYNRPHWSWSIGSKDMCSWRVAKTIGNKEIICFIWQYLKISICEFLLIFPDHITIKEWQVKSPSA